jgi:hypothetical protein
LTDDDPELLHLSFVPPPEQGRPSRTCRLRTMPRSPLLTA